MFQYHQTQSNRLGQSFLQIISLEMVLVPRECNTNRGAKAWPVQPPIAETAAKVKAGADCGQVRIACVTSDRE